MNEIELIGSKICEIRGLKVILDFNLANMYQVETRILNQAVKRNIERFPEDFMFQLTEDEWNHMSSQFVMTSTNKRPKKSLPYAFTEHGVVMLSSVLRSSIAVQVSILVTRAFVMLRQMLAQPKTDRFSILEERVNKLEGYLEEILADVNEVNEDTRMQIELINESLAEMQSNKKLSSIPRPKIGFI